jgi:hypothetical protein
MRRPVLTALLFIVFSMIYLDAAGAGSQLPFAGRILGFKICTGTYALCAAAICTPIPGGTVEVNTVTGTADFPAANCTCPVYTGPAMADVNGGNMQGSCAPPGPNQIWSLYYRRSHQPQQINNWSAKPEDTATPFQVCANVWSSFANCFSFACTLDRKRQNRVRTATCTCALGENLDGTPVAPGTAIISPAGQCDANVCNEHPMGMADPDLANSDVCLGLPSGSKNSQLQFPLGN